MMVKSRGQNHLDNQSICSLNKTPEYFILITGEEIYSESKVSCTEPI